MMTIEKILNALQECIALQYNGICDNEKHCANCNLALNKDEMLQAFDFIIDKLKYLEVEK